MNNTPNHTPNCLTYHFCVAELPFSIAFVGYKDGLRLLSSFVPFINNNDVVAEEENNDSLLFKLTVDDSLRPEPKADRERIRDFDTGNGITIVDKLKNGGYQYIIKDINGSDCCLLITDKEFRNCRCALNGDFIMRSFGLNNAIMLVYAFAAAYRDTVLVHASVVRQNGYGYAFIAKSGTGKSTQVSNWLRFLPGCDLMNDDNPVVRVIDGKSFIYGSPWSGKTPCYRNIKAPLGAVTRIDRAPANSIEKVNVLEAFASLLPSVSSMKWDENLYEKICTNISRIIETTPIYTLHCLPDRNSAEVCNRAISKKDK
jgi:hypothetical protein